MNIDNKRKQAILKLYFQGESIETLQILTGFSLITIKSIVNKGSWSKRDILSNYCYKTG